MSTSLDINWTVAGTVVPLNLGVQWVPGIVLSGTMFSTVAAWREFLTDHAEKITIVDEAGLVTPGTEFLPTFESLVATSLARQDEARREVEVEGMTVLDGPPVDRQRISNATWFDPEGPMFLAEPAVA